MDWKLFLFTVSVDMWSVPSEFEPVTCDMSPEGLGWLLILFPPADDSLSRALGLRPEQIEMSPQGLQK